MNPSLGYALVSSFAEQAALDELAAFLPSVPSRSGSRDLLASGDLAAAVRATLLPIAEQVLGVGAIAVGATLFDKRPARNWKVSWHQDLSIPATGAQADVVLKDGVPHVQPSEGVLAALLIARLHLDPSNERTGGLAIVPGSHLQGRIPENEIPSVVREFGVLRPDCPAGSVFLMRPLLLHSSSASKQPVSRRVLQVLFAPGTLVTFPWFRAAA